MVWNNLGIIYCVLSNFKCFAGFSWKKNEQSLNELFRNAHKIKLLSCTYVKIWTATIHERIIKALAKFRCFVCVGQLVCTEWINKASLSTCKFLISILQLKLSCTRLWTLRTSASNLHKALFKISSFYFIAAVCTPFAWQNEILSIP